MYILQLFKKLIQCFLNVIFRVITVLIPIKKKSILFMAFHGRGYLDNPKAIYEKIQKDGRFEGYEMVWVLNDTDESLYSGKRVKYLSAGYFFYLARCKYWIINCKLPEYIHKKANQVYVQTWHGTPLKKLGLDICVSADKFSRSGLSLKKMGESYKKDAMKYDFMISPNPFSTQVFQSAFGIKRDFLIETGYPRNDILSNVSAEDVEKLKTKYGIPEDKKVILYAPTWRDDEFDVSGYQFSLCADFMLWKEKLQDCIVLFKAHYLIANHLQINSELSDFVYVMDAKCDINDLYRISDCLVTDYSSVFFDYAILGRPIYFYMYDLEKYKDELRGFYLNVYEDLPGEIYKEEDSLLSAIDGNVFEYSKLDEFNKRFNALQTGDCAEKVIRKVFGERIENEI